MKKVQNKQRWMLGLLGFAVASAASTAHAAVIYSNNFGTTAISGSSYTGSPTLDAAITSAVWTTSASGFTSFSGSSGQALALNNSSGTPTITLTLTLSGNYTFSFTDWSMWRQRSTTGAQNYSLSVNGTQVNTGTVPTSGVTTGALTPSTTSFGGVSGTNTYTFVLGLSGASGSGTFRFDDFLINGTFTSAGGATPSTLFWNGSNNTWDTTNSYWRNSSGNSFVWSNATNGPATVAQFSTGNTVGIVAGGVIAKGLTFDSSSNGIVLAGGGGSVTLTSSAVVVEPGVTAAINAKLSGTANLNVSGGGTLVLGNPTNDFSSSVSIGNGTTVRIGSDGALGNSGNDVILGGGTLRTTASIGLGAGRDITGSGTLDIGIGTTLTTNGNVNLTNTTLNTSGTLALNGSSNTFGALTLSAAASITGNSVNITNITTSHIGTADIVNNIEFGNANRNIDVAADGMLILGGTLNNGTSNVRLTKLGAGTLRLEGVNANLNAIRIGSAGATPLNGGTVVITNADAAGSRNGAQIQLNYGSLEATSDLTLANGLSIGGRVGAIATLGGGDMTFNGTTSFFRAASTTGALRLDVHNTTTIAGTIAGTSGTGTASGITLGGGGTLILSSDASAITETITLQDTVTLVVNNNLGGAVVAGTGTTVKGSGTFAALTIGEGGIFAPGTSPGITNTGALTIAGGATYEWEHIAGNALGTAGDTYDFVNVTSAIVSIDSTESTGSKLDLVFDAAITDFSNAFWNSSRTWSIIGATGDIASENYFDISNIRVFLDNVEAGVANVVTGQGYFTTTVNGASVDLIWTPVSTIPEPTSLALLGLGAAGLLLRRRKA